MNLQIFPLRLAWLFLLWAWNAPAGPAVTAQPVSQEISFPLALPTPVLSESVFFGVYIQFSPVPGPYPPGFPTQRDVSFSAIGHGYTGLGTSGPWLYFSAANGAAGIRFYVWEDGGRQSFYREYVLETNGTYKTYAYDQSDDRVLIQAGTYRMYDYEGPASRSTVNFSVVIESNEPATVQWYFDNVPLKNGLSAPFIYYFESVLPAGQTLVTGGQTTLLSISNVTRLNAGAYYCVVTSSSGAVTSSIATLTVNGHPSRDLTSPAHETTIPEHNIFHGSEPIRVTFVSGKASDDTGVGSVFWLFGTNHYGPINIGPKADSMRETLWGGNLQLTPGTNILGVYAVDVYGNRSQTNTRVFYYETNSGPFTTVLKISIDGKGTVTPLTNGQAIVVGQRYQVQATPDAGYRFDHWNDNVELQKPLLSFYAEEYQTLTAYFSKAPAPPAQGLLTFNDLTNTTFGFPILSADGDNRARLLIAGPSEPLPTGWNPIDGTPALKLDSSIEETYILTLSGIRAPFVLKGFDVVSVSGSFTMTDTESGARYDYDGSLGHKNLGRLFRRAKYIVIAVTGEVVLDNFEYRLLELAPIARARVWNELKLPSIDAIGNSILDEEPPFHLDNLASFHYPGYSGFWHYLLAPGTNALPFVLDASKSRDPDGDALKFRWSYYTGGNNGAIYPLAGGVASRSPYFKNRPPQLKNSVRHELVLTVEDKYLSDQLWFGVVVLTPQDASRFMWDWLENNFDAGNDPSGVVGQLIPILQQAESKFASGQMRMGRQSLKEFKRLTKAQLRQVNSAVTRALVALTDAVLDITKDAE